MHVHIPLEFGNVKIWEIYVLYFFLITRRIGIREVTSGDGDVPRSSSVPHPCCHQCTPHTPTSVPPAREALQPSLPTAAIRLAWMPRERV